MSLFNNLFSESYKNELIRRENAALDRVEATLSEYEKGFIQGYITGCADTRPKHFENLSRAYKDSAPRRKAFFKRVFNLD